VFGVRSSLSPSFVRRESSVGLFQFPTDGEGGRRERTRTRFMFLQHHIGHRTGSARWHDVIDQLGLLIPLHS